MPIHIEWLSLALGIAIGLIVHQVCTHPKSPLSGSFTDMIGR